jgi:antitoxin (DNA-binding transcriptional repressor) of toxin-antitoxin stability system
MLDTTALQDHDRAFTGYPELAGPLRRPQQLLADQRHGDRASVHDASTADALGLAGAPIEGPTHFSQFDPLAYACWGRRWFELGCISAHFQTMVFEGEEVTARLTPQTSACARIVAAKGDGTAVLTGTATVDRSAPTELDERRSTPRDRGELFIMDQLEVGQRTTRVVTSSVGMDEPNGALYPFSLRQKLAAITEPSPWYSTNDTPWGRPILPIEMISVLAQKSGHELPIRGPAIGLFLDLEIRLEGAPLFVDQDYSIEREVIGVSQSKRTESCWIRSSLTDADTRVLAATVTLHSGVFKESYAGYPKERL